MTLVRAGDVRLATAIVRQGSEPADADDRGGAAGA